MSAMTSQFTGVSIVCSTVWLGADQRKQHSSGDWNVGLPVTRACHFLSTDALSIRNKAHTILFVTFVMQYIDVEIQPTVSLLFSVNTFTIPRLKSQSVLTYTCPNKSWLIWWVFMTQTTTGLDSELGLTNSVSLSHNVDTYVFHPRPPNGSQHMTS